MQLNEEAVARELELTTRTMARFDIVYGDDDYPLPADITLLIDRTEDRYWLLISYRRQPSLKSKN